MVPVPIALLTLFYGVIAAVSAADAWRALAGVIHRPIVWPLAWLALSSGAMCGLPLLRPWGRTCAIWTSVGLLIAALASSASLVAAGRPGAGLLVTFSTAVHAVMLRYLQRPSVKAYFDDAWVTNDTDQ